MSIISKFSLALGVMALVGCGSAKTQSGNDTHAGPGANIPNKPVSAQKIYGVWEGKGADQDGSHPYALVFKFEPGRVSLVKECFLRVGKVSVSAVAATSDDGSGQQVSLTGVLGAFATMDGQKCSIDFPYGLEFILRDGKIVARLKGTEKVSSLKKSAEL